MRTISTDDQQLRDAGGMTAYVRLSVKDSGGTWRDLTTYAQGEDLVDTVEWKENTDDPGPTFTATLKREVEMLSLAPLVAASALNLGFNPAGSYAPLLALTSEVLIETAVVPEGAPPSGWKKVFRGQIDEIDWASDPLTLNGRGPQAKIVDAFIKRERVYAYCQGVNATRGAFIYELDRDYALGDLVLPTDGNRNGHFYKCTTAGHSFVGDEPTPWPTGSGATVGVGTAVFTEAGTTSDTLGTPVETVMQQLLDDHLGAGAVTLHVPSSPGWEIRCYKQDCVGLWEALAALAEQSTFDLRYRYDSGADDFLLKLLAIDRAKTTPDHTFGPGEYRPPTRLETKVDDIRNDVDVVFSNSAVTDAAGQFVRSLAHAEDSTSISEFDDRYCRVSEASASNIDTQTEADAYAQIICSDLSQPNAEQEVPMDYWEFVEFGDLYRFSPDALRFDSNLDLAPVGYSHKFDNSEDGPTTTLTCRGKPSGGYDRWIRKEARSFAADTHSFNLFNTSGITVTTQSVPGGTRVLITPTDTKPNHIPPNYEVHVSDTSGFTPGPSTLVARGSSHQLTLADQNPGKTFYVRVRPYGYNDQRIVTGNPTAELSYTAGRAKAGHLVDDVTWNKLPLNGAFETAFDGVQPDHWEFQSGLPGPTPLWGTDAVWLTDGNGISGAGYVKITNARSSSLNVQVVGAFIPVDDVTQQYRISFARKFVSGSGSNFAVGIEWFDETKGTPFSSSSVNYSLTDHVGSWVKGEIYGIPPTGARFARVGFALASGSAREAHVDSLVYETIGDPWFAVGGGATMEDGNTAPAFGTNWGNTGGSYSSVALRKTDDGLVELTGTASRGVAGIGTANPIFTLPAGWRPPATVGFAVSANGRYAQLEVDSSGKVAVIAGDSANPQTQVSLDGVRFRTW